MTSPTVANTQVPNLTEEQQVIYDYIVSTKRFAPVFVSGAAGTGKSMLLRRLIKAIPQSICVAYTNIAARNIDGITLHKHFGLNHEMKFTKKMLSFPKVLFIDEISMVPGSFLDRFDKYAREQYLADASAPFGGINLVVFGDLYQLPPVPQRGDNNSPPDYPFLADVWKQFRLYELKCNMRQTETDFIYNLNKLRTGNKACLDFFNTLVVKNSPSVDEAMNMTNLVATRREAKEINGSFYDHLRDNGIQEDMQEYTSKIVKTGYFTFRELVKIPIYPIEQLCQIFDADMKFCVGTRIMCTANAGICLSYCNGDIGTITKIEQKEGTTYVTMKREFDGKDVLISPITLYFKQPRLMAGKPVVQCRGLPFTYGWACTIHKAQGIVTDKILMVPKWVPCN